MKNTIFVIIAAAFVSMAPFLTLFDPECYPTSHGFISFSILALFFLFANIKKNVKKQKNVFLLTLSTYILTTTISWIDLQGILDLLEKETGAYGIIPFVCSGIAMLILKSVKEIPISQINLILFSIFFLHLASFYTTINIPILDFTLLKIIK